MKKNKYDWSMAILISTIVTLSACSQEQSSESATNAKHDDTATPVAKHRYSVTKDSIQVRLRLLNPGKGVLEASYPKKGATPEVWTVVNDDASLEVFEHTFTFPAGDPRPSQIKLFGKGYSFIMPGVEDIAVEIDCEDGLSPKVISGSKDTEYLAQNMKFDARYRDINQEMNMLIKSSPDTYMGMAKYQQLTQDFEKLQNEVRVFAKTHQESVVAAMVMTYLDVERDGDFVFEIAKGLYEKYPDVEQVEHTYQIAKSFADILVGKPSPEITLAAPSGESIALSSLKGKYVLIDFWASWCRPCRVENPRMVAMYNRFKDQDFEIYGVSLDKSKEKWEMAIQQDGIPWIHVSDLQGWKSEAAQIYKVNAIPFTVLLDPDGMILAKGLRGAELEEKLAEVLL